MYTVLASPRWTVQEVDSYVRRMVCERHGASRRAVWSNGSQQTAADLSCPGFVSDSERWLQYMEIQDNIITEVLV